MNHEKDFLRRAAAAGYTLEVSEEGKIYYLGPDAKHAWKAVINLAEANVHFLADGKVLGWALFYAYGLAITDYSASGPIYLIAKAIEEENQ